MERTEEEIRERLKVLRKRSGLSARKASVAIGCGEGYVSKIEREDHFPSMACLQAMLEAYNSSLEELYYENFETYNLDKQIFDLLKIINPNRKTRLITLLTIMKSIDMESDSVLNLEATKNLNKGLKKLNAEISKQNKEY